MNANEIISTLKKGDKVFLDDGTNPHKGFVVDVDEKTITINIFVPNIDVTFQRYEIVEITKI